MTEIETYGAGGLGADEIQAFLTAAARECPLMPCGPELSSWAAKLSSSADVVCVRNADGRIIGAIFCYCNDNQSKISYLTLICVLHECAKGSAYELSKAYDRLAMSRGMRRQRLEVHKSNGHALQFYIRQGYGIVEDRGDKWLMDRETPNLLQEDL